MERKISNIINHAEVSEKAIEQYLVDRAKQLGFPCLKYSNPNMVGYPDRILVLPQGRIVWVELKSKGCKPSRIQEIRFATLNDMGHLVCIADSKETVDFILNTVRQ